MLFKKLSNPDYVEVIAEPVKALTKSCFDAAEKSIRILAALHSQDLLGNFPPCVDAGM